MITIPNPTEVRQVADEILQTAHTRPTVMAALKLHANAMNVEVAASFEAHDMILHTILWRRFSK